TLTVVVCTRGRDDRLHHTLDALARQENADFDLIVVDQSEQVNPALERRATAEPRLVVIDDSGCGLSRARNIGWRAARSEWVAFVDDDCRPDPDWALELRRAIAEHTEASFISGDVRADVEKPPEYLFVTLPRVAEERRIQGWRTTPQAIGMGVCMAIKRTAIMELGGFDERLGPGVSPFPAADDTDFNYRFLRAEGVAYVTPKIRAVHEQWRSPRDTVTLYQGYSRSWAGFAMKHVRIGDPAGGLWLWLIGIRHVLGMLQSAVRLSSGFRLRVAGAMLIGFVSGTVRGGLRRW
ncbi:MAG: glycosyltransferase family 2 protein, partial [Vicinamibacterales bacterium]